VAATLRDEPDLAVNVIDGSKGEFTVLVDGREVARKAGEALPTAGEVRAAVRNAAPAYTGAG
jgi:hypothetical protein